MTDSPKPDVSQPQNVDEIRLLDSFHRISRSMLVSMDRDVILDTMCREIVHAGILRSLMVALVDEKKREVRVVKGYVRTLSDQIRDRSDDFSELVYGLDDENITAEVARTGTMQVIDGWDPRLDSKFDRQDEPNPPKVAYFIPVSHGPKVYAVLATGSSPEERSATLRRIDAMAPLLDHFVIALNHIRQYEKAQSFSTQLARSHHDLGHEMEERKRAEQELKLFYHLNLDMMCIAGFDGYFRHLNPSWSKTLGFTDEELKARPFIEFVHPDDREKTVAAAARLADKSIDAIAFENRYACKDGSYRWLSWNATAYEPFEAIYATARDITVHRKAEQALKESEARYSDLFENATDLIQIVSPDGDYLYTNRAWKESLGYTDAEIEGLSMFDILHPDQQSHCHDVFSRVMTGEAVGRVETIFVTKDGRSIDVEGDINCKMDNGRPVSTRGIFRDITERKIVDQMKSEFISTVSHELRTPLTSIHGSLGLIVGGVAGELSEQTRSLIEIAHTNTDRLVRLINDILDMEKIESGRMVFNNGPVLLMPLVRQTIESNRGYADGFGVTLKLVASIADAEVFGDHDRLTQVLTNLISNAAKFSPEGETVEVAVTQRDNKYQVIVADHGPGISSDFQLKVFQKFAQEDATNTRQKGGTGLGLSISKAIVDRLDGDIWFENGTDGGTNFVVEFPVHERMTQDPAGRPVSKFQRGVLICEDDRDIAQLLRLLLEKEGYQVDVAYSVEQARRLLDGGSYAAMTLDLILPGEDGLAFIKEIRCRKDTQDLPIIVVSAKARDSQKDLQNGDAVWVIDWIDKPIDSSRLSDAVSMAYLPEQGRKIQILHIEDDQDLHSVVTTQLRAVADLTWAGNLLDARRRLYEGRYDLVLLDIGLPDGSGLDILTDIRERSSSTIPVIIFSGQDSPGSTVQDVAASLVKSKTSGEELVGTIVDVIRDSRVARKDG
ncbi:MAG: PAS domain S-box protein [Candidatus Latescibacteria bacterium]|nr:PAS domain S-box protein [Candidatus Latescibacterota bacterium]